MPVYNFECVECSATFNFKVPYSEKDQERSCIKCSKLLKRIYNPPSKSSVLELGSKYHNKSYKKGMQDVLKRRSRDDSLSKIGEIVEKQGFDAIKNTNLVKNGKKRTIWDDK